MPAAFHSELVIPRHEPSMTNMIRRIKEIVPIFLFKLSGIFSLCEMEKLNIMIPENRSAYIIRKAFMLIYISITSI